jgi:hypothetical protein
MSELPTGTLTILHTDIENSTPLTVHPMKPWLIRNA